ncbi:uncharacterized protein KZ484_005238 isoform 2-T3 [Pholidichthys leucotaenia]
MMNNPGANKSHIPCQLWTGQDAWSATSSQASLMTQLSMGSSSDQRASYDLLQAPNQSCMSDPTTLSSRNNTHAALYTSPHTGNISSSSSMFANIAASHLAFTQQSSHPSMVVSTNQGKSILPPPNTQPNVQSCRPQQLQFHGDQDPCKVSFQSPLSNQGLPNRAQDLSLSLSSCRQRQAAFEGENVGTACVTGNTQSYASSTSQGQIQWIPSSQFGGDVNESVPNATVYTNKEGNIPPEVSSESQRSALLHQRAQLLKQLAEMDKLLESLPPEDGSDGQPTHTAAAEPSLPTDSSSQHKQMVEKSKSRPSADSSSALFFDEENDTCDEENDTCVEENDTWDAPEDPVLTAESVKKEPTSDDDCDPDYLPDSDGDCSDVQSVPKENSSDESSHSDHERPSQPVKEKTKSRSIRDKIVLPPQIRAADRKKASETAASESEEKRVGKRSYCTFCGKPVAKIARHLERIHTDKAEVAAAFKYPKHSKERKMVWKRLRMEGNFAHNKMVLKTGEGELAIGRRPLRPTKVQDFVHCLYCYGAYNKKHLWRHMKNCSERLKTEEEPDGTRRRFASRCVLAAVDCEDLGITDCVKTILSDMIYDEVTQAIMDDRVLLQLTEYMFSQRVDNANKNSIVRQNIRQMARLVLEAQKNTPMQKLEDFFYPSNFKLVVSAVNTLSGYDPETKMYRIPSLAYKLGYHLQKACSIVERNAKKHGDTKVAESARNFLSLYEKKWKKNISSGALTSIRKVRLNRKKVVPSIQDVKRLYFHMEKAHLEADKNLRDTLSAENYAALAKVVLACIVFFNNRTPREVSTVELSAFESRKKSDIPDDVDISVTDLEKIMCPFFVRIDIRGSCGRKVPILLKPLFESSLELLVDFRKACGIPSKNPFLFGRPTVLSPYRATDCVQQYVKECGAKKPEALSMKGVKKHFGKMLQLMSLDESEADEIFGPNNNLQILRLHINTTLDDTNVDLESGARIQPSRRQQVTSRVHKDRFGASSRPADSCHQQTQGATTSSCMTTSKQSRGRVTSDFSQSRRKWDDAEVHAVERHMMRFIKSHKVPGKDDCVACLEAEPRALGTRSWKGVKDYVRNRITTLKRQSSSSQSSSKNTKRPRCGEAEKSGRFQQL